MPAVPSILSIRSVQPQICHVLQASHRRLRRWDVLWAVQSLAQRYRILARRRELKEKAYAIAAERALDDNEIAAYRRCQEAVRRAASMEVRPGHGCLLLHAEMLRGILATMWGRSLDVWTLGVACGATSQVCAQSMYALMMVVVVNAGDRCTSVPGLIATGVSNGGMQAQGSAVWDQSLQAACHCYIAAVWHAPLLTTTLPCPSHCSG